METGRSGVRPSRLDPKLDIVFWMLFGAEQNRELLLSLLNAVLRPAVAIASAELLHAQPERLGVDDTSLVLDARVRLANGEVGEDQPFFAAERAVQRSLRHARSFDHPIDADRVHTFTVEELWILAYLSMALPTVLGGFGVVYGGVCSPPLTNTAWP